MKFDTQKIIGIIGALSLFVMSVTYILKCEKLEIENARLEQVIDSLETVNSLRIK